jgi:hypothetical protein
MEGFKEMLKMKPNYVFIYPGWARDKQEFKAFEAFKTLKAFLTFGALGIWYSRHFPM